MASSTAAAVKASGDGEQAASFGILIVGIGGNNGVTLLAGIQANQQVSRILHRVFLHWIDRSTRASCGSAQGSGSHAHYVNGLHELFFLFMVTHVLLRTMVWYLCWGMDRI